MKGIDKARSDLDAANARGDDDDFMKRMGQVLAAGVDLKKAMVERGLTKARKTCPICKKFDALHGVLITGPAAGRHRRSGGAFRMWCDTPGCAQMME